MNAPESVAALRQLHHDDAERRGQDGYIDPVTGLFVMTHSYLLRKGPCCANHCRHCPYGESGTD